MLVLKDVLTDMAKAIVEKPDSVSVTEAAGEDGEVLLTLSVDPDDMGKVIGRHGRIAKALRTIMKAAATSVDQKGLSEGSFVLFGGCHGKISDGARPRDDRLALHSV